MSIKKGIVGRLTAVYLVVVLFALLIVGKIAYLQISEQDRWADYAKRLSQRDLYFPALRGDIYADNNEVLATSVPYYDVFFDPKAQGLPEDVFFEQIDSLSIGLSKMFGKKTAEEYSAFLQSAREKGSRYVPIKKRINYNKLQELKKLPIFNRGRFKGGLIVEQTNLRLKPFSQLASRTIGYISQNPNGNIVGLEGAFDNELKGRDGIKLMRKVAGNQWMEMNSENEVEREDGYNVVSTINIPLQDVAENTLYRQLAKYEAHHGTAILMEVKTGDIKAIANLKRGKDGKYHESYNYAVGESTEPGSTFKLATVIALLEDGFIDLYDTVDTGNGSRKFYDFTIRDVKMTGHGRISFQKVFEVSSNVGIATVVDKYYGRQADRFVERLHSLGLNQKQNISINGEGKPYIKYQGDRYWSEISLHQMALGYELKLTPLQILTLYNAVANDGVMVKPRFVQAITKHGKIIKKFNKEILMPSICSDETLKKVKIMLEGVVENGTGRRLQNPNFKIAGKTGTAKIFDPKKKRYVNRYKASFVGYFPADNPQYSCIVMISDPNSLGYYGGLVAGPVFEEIANKVYSTNYKLTPNLELVDKYGITSIPYSKNGNLSDLEIVLQKLNIPLQFYNNLKSDWVITEKKEKHIECQDRIIRRNIVPNILGMSVRDAMFILEDLGLNVKINGKGAVSRQSQIAGTKLIKGSKIILYLGKIEHKEEQIVENQSEENENETAE
ncbi:MAG: transpeptidase family protein [Bacteroidales bacterium]|nr:transpeptidase family protein [Bacteroidales bacterium]